MEGKSRSEAVADARDALYARRYGRKMEGNDVRDTRFCVMMTAGELEGLRKWAIANGFDSTSEAARALMAPAFVVVGS